MILTELRLTIGGKFNSIGKIAHYKISDYIRVPNKASGAFFSAELLAI